MSAVPPPPPPPSAVVPPGETKTCPKCAMVIPKAAKFCPHCQKRLGTHPVTMGCAVIAVFFVGLWIIGTMLSGGAKPVRAPSRTPNTSDLSAADIAAAHASAEKFKAEAEAYLKTPGGKVLAKHPGWSHEDCDAIAKRKVHVGMTAEQVRLAWGKPEHINTTTTGTSEHEQWVWGHSQYAYFEGGILTSLQQSN